MSEREEINRIQFTVALIAEFAEKYGIDQVYACNYLTKYKGMDHLQEFYGVLHTFSFEDNIEILSTICHRNGGELIYPGV